MIQHDKNDKDINNYNDTINDDDNDNDLISIEQR